jgi:hypothetical protein
MAFEQYENEEDKIQEKLKQKTWNEIRTNDSWGIFKIMSEFVNGYESMARIGPCVSIFGSARIKPDNKYYLLAEKIAYKISKAGYGVITGGGPGIMEAGNKGAHNGEGTSVGLNIELPFEQHYNPYIDKDKNLNFTTAFNYVTEQEASYGMKSENPVYRKPNRSLSSRNIGMHFMTLSSFSPEKSQRTLKV